MRVEAGEEAIMIMVRAKEIVARRALSFATRGGSASGTLRFAYVHFGFAPSLTEAAYR